MTLATAGIAYLALGAALALVVWRKNAHDGRRALASAALTVAIWPLWAPMALAPEPRPRPARPPASDSARRIDAALREGLDAARGTPLAALLSSELVERVIGETLRAESRVTELDALLRRDGFDVAAAEARVAALEREGAPSRTLATARMHHDNVVRLARLRDRDARALTELALLVEALRTQIVLARYAGSSIEGASGIVSEVQARVEGLGEAIDAGAAEDEGT